MVIVIPIIIGGLGTLPKRYAQGTGRLKNQWTSRNYLDNSIIRFGQNTEKSPKDLRRFTLSHYPVKGHKLTLQWKTLKVVK